MNIFFSSFRFKVGSGFGSAFFSAGYGSVEKNDGSSSLYITRLPDVCDQDVCDQDVCDPDVCDLDVCDHLFVTKTFVTRTFVTILKTDVCDQELKF